MRKPDFMAVLTIAILAGVILTMFFQGGDLSIAQAEMSNINISQTGWGQVRSH
jgi:hypothetical protein